MSIVKSFSLFYISLMPLWVSICLIDGKNIYCETSNIYTEFISLGTVLIVMIISAIVTIVTLRKSDQNGAQPYTLTSIKEEKLITAEHVLTYVLPLFAFDFTVWYEVILFLLFFFVLAFLHIHHNRLSANIVLEIFGYRYYECELENDDKKSISKNIISRYNLLTQKDCIIDAKPLNNEYYLDVTYRNT